MPTLLDLFCGAGGASVGYHRAGFNKVYGVDILEQPNYPFKAVVLDSFKALESKSLKKVDLIHASPPCQAYSSLQYSRGAKDYPEFIPLLRSLLEDTGLPYVIENVPTAPLKQHLVLCGSSFGLRFAGCELRRHRLFEFGGFSVPSIPCNHRYPVLGVYGDLYKGRRISARSSKASVEEAKGLMQIHWMTGKEMVDAIPPAYTEYIGRVFLTR